MPSEDVHVPLGAHTIAPRSASRMPREPPRRPRWLRPRDQPRDPSPDLTWSPDLDPDPAIPAYADSRIHAAMPMRLHQLLADLEASLMDTD